MFYCLVLRELFIHCNFYKIKNTKYFVISIFSVLDFFSIDFITRNCKILSNISYLENASQFLDTAFIIFCIYQNLQKWKKIYCMLNNLFKEAKYAKRELQNILSRKVFTAVVYSRWMWIRCGCDLFLSCCIKWLNFIFFPVRNMAWLFRHSMLSNLISFKKFCF
jgi:hypothetical protein